MTINEKLEWDEGREVSIEEFYEVESKLGITFPDDYKTVVVKNDGGLPSLPALDFAKFKEKVFVGLIPLSKSNDYAEPIISYMSSFDEELPKGIIPFGEDPFGNLYCFDYRSNSQPTIAYWNHEDEMNANNQFTYVAKNFSEFLYSLYLPED